MNKQKHNGVLKNISPKCQWGFRPTVSRNGLVSIGDHEFVTAVGSRMVLYENNNQQKRTVLVDSKFPDVLYVTLMVVSPDRNYLATLVRMKNDQNTANVLIYQIGDRFKSYYKPSHISFENSAFIDGGAAFEFTSLAFCHDSQFIACATNVPSIGVLIYERRSSKIYQRISTDDAVISVTFHPQDSSKICTTGHGTLFKFWRYTSKSVHATPVTGLRSGNYSYTCHAWITTSEATVVGATNEGFLALVQGSEQTAPIQYAFGAPFQMNSVATPVMDLVVNGDVVFAVSQLNLVAVYEVRRNLAAKGSNKLSASLHLLARYKLINVDRLYGLQLCLHDSLSSFQLVGVSSNMMFTAEIISEKDVAFGSVQMPEKDTHAKRGSDIKEPSIYWIEYSNEKVIQRFHSGNIDSFALSGQTNSFISSSYEDQSIRVWDYDKFHASFDGSFVVESFLTRDEEMPFVVVMHPSGLFVACGFENDVREYAITDSTLDSVRKISTRDSYTGPTGAPYMVTQPVSIIRYSHGGHLMLVVTGKLVQIFHLYRKNYATSNTSGT